MAAIARSDVYDHLVRKIGYSVGLEYLVPRVRDVLDTFMLSGILDGAAWRRLVQECWSRNMAAEQHIADVYSHLDILRRQNSSIHALPGLEAMAVLCSGNNVLAPGATSNCLSIVRFVLLLKVLEADGDIFLNALAAGFDPNGIEIRLKAMIRHKRRSVAPLFPQAGSIRRLMDAISIRNQASSAGKAGTGPKKQTYAQRSRLLMATTADDRFQIQNWTEQEVPLSRDYLEKVCLTRRGWAEDFGLYERQCRAISSLGTSMLERLRQRGLWIQDGSDDFFAFWPYPFQLSKMNLRPGDIGAPDFTPWDLASDVATVLMEQPGGNRQQDTLSRSELVSLLQHALSRHQQVSPRGVLRHELPLFIAEPVLAWWIAEAGRAAPDFRGFLRDELRRTDRILDFVTIHGTEGGVRLMKEGSERAAGG